MLKSFPTPAVLVQPRLPIISRNRLEYDDYPEFALVKPATIKGVDYPFVIVVRAIEEINGVDVPVSYLVEGEVYKTDRKDLGVLGKFNVIEVINELVVGTYSKDKPVRTPPLKFPIKVEGETCTFTDISKVSKLETAHKTLYIDDINELVAVVRYVETGDIATVSENFLVVTPPQAQLLIHKRSNGKIVGELWTADNVRYSMEEGIGRYKVEVSDSGFLKNLKFDLREVEVETQSGIYTKLTFDAPLVDSELVLKCIETVMAYRTKVLSDWKVCLLKNYRDDCLTAVERHLDYLFDFEIESLDGNMVDLAEKVVEFVHNNYSTEETSEERTARVESFKDKWLNRAGLE